MAGEQKQKPDCPHPRIIPTIQLMFHGTFAGANQADQKLGKNLISIYAKYRDHGSKARSDHAIDMLIRTLTFHHVHIYRILAYLVRHVLTIIVRI
jgi:2-methylaconitate cis-trans-isomerase PrpF